jgi:hypothetical protein
MTHLQVITWRQAIAKAASEGEAGLSNLRADLQQASTSQDHEAIAASLDIVFGAQPGLGAQLLLYSGGTAAGLSQGTDNTASLKRGITLIQEGKFVEARQFFDQQIKSQATKFGSNKGGSSRTDATPMGNPIAMAYLALCDTKLGMPPGPAPPPLVNVPMNGKPASTHPVQHLANALEQRQGTPAAPSDYSSKRQSELRRAGQALAFLLHPLAADPAQVPACLRQEALQLLQGCALALTSPDPIVPGQLNGSRAGPKELRATWQEHLKRFPALAKLQDLIGLSAVKD